MLGTINDSFELLYKIKNAFSALKISGVFTKEVEISDLVETYFSSERLKSDKVKLTGILSPYVANCQYPIYSPLDTKNTVTRPLLPEEKREDSDATHQLQVKIGSLNVPAIKLNPITLSDGTRAKILWLYPSDATGLLFPLNTSERVGLMPQNLNRIFEVTNSYKPLPILFDIDLLIEPLLYQVITLTGRIITSPRCHFDVLSDTMNPLQLKFFSNCIRPFSDVDGVLAIDARKPFYKINFRDSIHKDFNIIYTVQGLLDIKAELSYRELKVLLAKYVDFIPDRQGFPQKIKTFLDSTESNIGSILTTGDISWQYSEPNRCFAAYISVNAGNPSQYQSRITQLAHHWQIWQRAISENEDLVRSDCNTLICSNNVHQNTFSKDGLQMSSSVRKALLSKNPEIRKSIDWLGISVGRS